MIKVACCGTFDYKIHREHLMFLGWAKSLGDHLCVFIVPNQIVIKNKNRVPIYNQDVRCINLLNVFIVDNVIPMKSKNEFESINEILQYEPDIYAFGSDQFTKFDEVLELELKNRNILTARSPYPYLMSTTKILEHEGLLSINEPR